MNYRINNLLTPVTYVVMLNQLSYKLFEIIVVACGILLKYSSNKMQVCVAVAMRLLNE